MSYRPILKLGSQCNQDSGILWVGSTIFVREILDGIVAKPGGVYHTVKYVAPWGASTPETCCNGDF
tara:strand:- start:133 stop:330 length:198 start_codon:yes stop_codon:yes gene_type:complete